MDEAMTLFSKMKGNVCLPNAVNYETIVGALLASNKNEQAVKLLHEMISEGLLMGSSNEVSKSMIPSEMGQVLEWESRSSNETQCQVMCKDKESLII
ncbi:Protein Rf1 [Arachis hypogaea]|nr:Protein Rf1 [Arachis hypogaea]